MVIGNRATKWSCEYFTAPFVYAITESVVNACLTNGLKKSAEK